VTSYSFKPRFIDPIVAGTKTQTIRLRRKTGHVPIGGKIQLYSGMRTKYCRKIGDAICLAQWPITIDLQWAEIKLAGDTIREGPSLHKFARQDGFASWDDMRRFWIKEHPNISLFEGFLIIWTDFVSALAE
jgi:hypothetical protein